MAAEDQMLSRAAEEFSAAIKAERERTEAQLAEERTATLEILTALRQENSARSRSIGARFFFGLLFGSAIGAAIAFALTPRSGTANRRDLEQRWAKAQSAFKAAVAQRESELWDDFRKRLSSQG